MRLLILSDIPAPYRIEVFKGLSKAFETTVFFNVSKNDSRNPDWYRKATTELYFEILDNDDSLNHYNDCIENIKQYDAVLCYDPWAKRSRALQRLCMRKRIPYILNADGALGITTSFPKKQIKTFYTKRAKMCFAGCERAVEYFKTYGAKDKNIVKHPFTSLYENQIIDKPISAEEKSTLKQELGMSGSTTFIAVGQFIHRKGFDLLLEAWSKTTQEGQLYIIGGGPKREEYEAYIKENDLKNVYIEDFKKPDELQKYYKASDVFVMPTREDIWGLVVNEAMAVGLPVITSDHCTSGNELVTNDVNGYVYPLEDTDMLASYIDKLAKDNALIGEFAEKSLEIIKEYTLENIISKHIESLNKLLKK